MTRPKIVFLDAATFGDISVQRFTDEWECTFYDVSLPGQVCARLSRHSIAVTNKVRIGRTELTSPSARKLKLIAVAATGTDIIDRQAAKEFDVTVSNVPAYASHSVAQFTIALVLELATGAGRYRDAVRSGVWQKSRIFALLDYPAIELRGKKLGIIGFGDIGTTVARMASGLGLDVLVAARPGSTGEIPNGRIPLERLLSESDFVSLHCPLTPATRNIINDDTLSLMKPTAFLINTARGALVDEAALLKALYEKRLAGAALDVISHEPPSADHPLMQGTRELDNLIVTPHTAWSAREARERLLSGVAENIAAFLNGKPRNIVV